MRKCRDRTIVVGKAPKSFGRREQIRLFRNSQGWYIRRELPVVLLGNPGIILPGPSLGNYTLSGANTVQFPLLRNTRFANLVNFDDYDELFGEQDCLEREGEEALIDVDH